MSTFLITGFPGVGKSTLAKELSRRGHKAYDPEKIRGIMHVEDRSTGIHITKPIPLPPGWYDNVGAFNWDISKLEKLFKTDEDVYICSLAHNQRQHAELFSQIFVLTLDDVELEQRLRSRDEHSLGKTKDEIQDIMKLHRAFEQTLVQDGAIEVNAANPPSIIVDTILSYRSKEK